MTIYVSMIFDISRPTRDIICRSAIRGVLGKWAKIRATVLNQGPIGMKVKNLQRGTANAVELGGKATVCISYVRYGS